MSTGPYYADPGLYPYAPYLPPFYQAAATGSASGYGAMIAPPPPPSQLSARRADRFAAGSIDSTTDAVGATAPPQYRNFWTGNDVTSSTMRQEMQGRIRNSK